MAVVQSKMIKQVVTVSLKCPIRQHHEIVFEELYCKVLNTVTLLKFFRYGLRGTGQIGDIDVDDIVMLVTL